MSDDARKLRTGLSWYWRHDQIIRPELHTLQQNLHAAKDDGRDEDILFTRLAIVQHYREKGQFGSALLALARAQELALVLQNKLALGIAHRECALLMHDRGEFAQAELELRKAQELHLDFASSDEANASEQCAALAQLELAVTLQLARELDLVAA